MTTFSDIYNAAQALPTMERLRLVDALCDSVPPQEWPSPSDEWTAEAQRRSAEYDAGAMSASPWSEVRQRARKKAGTEAKGTYPRFRPTAFSQNTLSGRKMGQPPDFFRRDGAS